MEALRGVFDTLTDEQKEKANACETMDDLMKFLGGEGIELPDGLLEGVAGGLPWKGIPIFGCNSPGAWYTSSYCIKCDFFENSIDRCLEEGNREGAKARLKEYLDWCRCPSRYADDRYWNWIKNEYKDLYDELNYQPLVKRR